jgi:hypothetical protein
MKEINLILKILSVFGTLFVAILAIWSDWFKYKLRPLKLKIIPLDLRGELTEYNNGKKVIYYHLKVKNLRVWSTAKNCRVILKAVSRELPNGEFETKFLEVTPFFKWAPATIIPPIVDISNEQTFDIGYIEQGGELFKLSLNWRGNNFTGDVKPGEKIRFTLEIVADSFKHKKPQVFEILWNGKWVEDLGEMSNNLIIKEI